MKLSDYIFLIVIALGVAYYLYFPNEIIKKETEYIKGIDTIEVVINQHKFDSLRYSFKAQIKKLKNSKTVFLDGKTDTLHDTVFVSFWSYFNLGDSALGTSGKVSFDFEDFNFDSVTYRYPMKIKTVTDTLKTINTISKPFYLDEWFYSSIALLTLIITLFGG